jgi:hypothetical protein
LGFKESKIIPCLFYKHVDGRLCGLATLHVDDVLLTGDPQVMKPVWAKLRSHLGVVQNYGTRKLPLRRAFANLSRPSRIGTWDYDQVFVCKFVTKIYRRIVFKNIADWRSVFKAALVTFLLCVMRLFQSTESMALGKSVFLWGRLTSGHWFCTHSLKSFWSCDIAERTSPFWARVGSGTIPFRKPFADLSRTFRGFLVKKMKFQIIHEDSMITTC